LRQRLYWGDIRYSPEAHDLVELEIPSQGYFETGIHLEELIRIKYFRSLFFNVGLGVYYAYGPYANAETLDNLVFKISAYMSTR
jgi:hypothetical protein